MPKRISNKIFISIDYPGQSSLNGSWAKYEGTYNFHSVRNKAAMFIKGKKKNKNNVTQQEGEEPYYLVYLETEPSNLSGWYIQDSKSFGCKKVEYYSRLVTKGLLYDSF